MASAISVFPWRCRSPPREVVRHGGGLPCAFDRPARRSATGHERAAPQHARLELGRGQARLLAGKLGQGTYRLTRKLPPDAATQAAIGWTLGTYAYDRYRTKPKVFASLVWPDGADRDHAIRSIEGVFLSRDLINTPANDLGPAELEDAARSLAKRHKAKVNVIVGDERLKQNYPTIHMVGRGSVRPPRLIDIRWGQANGPRVTLVGKGVCFDTGGLDIKPASGMLLMKKDMGGAANVLGLASMIMAAGLNLRLRVLIPAVENAIAGNSFRPGDVLMSRKGLTVEIGNTDAEGRLILADALALADEEKPDLLVDVATLTGAARVALGPDLPPFFTDDEYLASDLSCASRAVADPIWRLPLWEPYGKKLASPIADSNNVTKDAFAGSITAALFLQRFVEKARSWVHFDIFGWNPSEKPHAPIGGEAQTIRALMHVLEARYGQ